MPGHAGGAAFDGRVITVREGVLFRRLREVVDQLLGGTLLGHFVRVGLVWSFCGFS